MKDPETIAAIVASIWTLVSLVVAFTRTPIDDALLTAVRAVFERLSFLQPKNSPGVVSLPGAAATRPHPPFDPDAAADEAIKEGAP